MNDAMAMKKRNGFIDVGKNGKDFIGGEGFLFLHEFEEVAIKARFHDKVDILFVMEEPIQLYNVGMVQVHLNFYFPQEGFFNILLLNDSLGYCFQCADKSSCLMPSLQYYYWAEYTFPYFPSPISSISMKSSKLNTFGSSYFECLKHLNFFEKFIEFWFFFYVVWQLLRRDLPSIEQYISFDAVNSWRVLSPSCNDILF